MAKNAQNITVEGIDELLHLLGDVTPKQARNIARSTVHAIAGVVRNQVRRHAPVDTGKLKKSIVTIRRRGTPSTVQSDVVIMHGKGQKFDAFYWHFVEFGTVDLPAQPFITPAVEEIGPQIPDMYRELFGQKLEKSLARKAKKK
jgi:HK97 gp10 family phage protein